MFNEINEQLRQFALEGETVALVQVVWRQAPSSGKPGDKAIITENGSLIGWIGGGCVKGIAIREGIRAIKQRKYRLVKIAPDNVNDQTDDHLKIYRMTCHSGGSMELFIEPIMPNPHIIILGKSNIARAISKLAKAANFQVSILSKNAEKSMFPTADTIIDGVHFDRIVVGSNAYVIVATQGEGDEESVKNSMLTPARYVGFIASARKSESIKQYLTDSGVDPDRVNQLRTPVGLNINAQVPEEVAISILAEVILEFRGGSPRTMTGRDVQVKDDYFLNPVCNLPISKADAKYITEYKNHTLYFCCDGCKISFDKDPEKYIAIMDKQDA
ncbi:MAG: XdhC family protein [Cyclobacteriaceae bacterium]|nr:XdhC family protein [Cyclobacteriaceae bacterium]